VSCELSQTRLHAYFDGELDAVGAAEFEGHLKSCAECQSALASEEALRSSIAQANLYERAPAGLRRSVLSQLAAPAAAPVRPVPRSNVGWRWLAFAASLLFVASLGWQAWERFGAERQPAVVAAALDAHLRSLQLEHLTDVQSTDQHTVKPWFDGKLDFAPPVRDFAGDGFPLLGGRLDVLDGKTVAALIYGRRKHIINVFVWPAASSELSKPVVGARRGYNWMEWQRGGFAFCAVSDVGAADLQQLQQLSLNP
jgi:anti-sigma factor (TIGR02949 family)